MFNSHYFVICCSLWPLLLLWLTLWWFYSQRTAFSFAMQILWQDVRPVMRFETRKVESANRYRRNEHIAERVNTVRGGSRDRSWGGEAELWSILPHKNRKIMHTENAKISTKNVLVNWLKICDFLKKNSKNGENSRALAKYCSFSSLCRRRKKISRF